MRRTALYIPQGRDGPWQGPVEVLIEDSKSAAITYDNFADTESPTDPFDIVAELEAELGEPLNPKGP